MLGRIALIFFLFVAAAAAQTGLTPSQIAYLNQLFAAAKEDSLPGLWLVDGSVTANKLSPSLMALINAPETDPVFRQSVAWSLTGSMISSWNAGTAAGNTALSWGNHAAVGYLTAETEPAYHASFGVTATNLYTGIITNIVNGTTNLFPVTGGLLCVPMLP